MEKQLRKKSQYEFKQQMDMNIETIIANYGKKLSIFAFSFVRDWDIVDDIMQEVYLKVFLKLDTVMANASLKSWLYTITSNQCMDYFRLKYVNTTILTDNFEGLIVSTSESVENEIIEESDKLELHKIINTLPKHYKDPLVLYYFYQLNYKEICAILKISLQNLKSRIHRAKKMIREKYLLVKEKLDLAF